jgi:hypothetical protein
MILSFPVFFGGLFRCFDVIIVGYSPSTIKVKLICLPPFPLCCILRSQTIWNARGWEKNSFAFLYSPKEPVRKKEKGSSPLLCCHAVYLSCVSSLSWIKFSSGVVSVLGVPDMTEEKSSLDSHPRPKFNYGNSLVPFRQTRSWEEKNFFLGRRRRRQLTVIEEKWITRQENQPSFPLFAFYHGELLLSIFSYRLAFPERVFLLRHFLLFLYFFFADLI